MGCPTGLIFDFELMPVAMASSSAAMEREGLQRIFNRLTQSTFTVIPLATDWSATVKVLMTREFDGIQHQLDIWHFVKSLVKKLTKATQKREMGSAEALDTLNCKPILVVCKLLPWRRNRA